MSLFKICLGQKSHDDIPTVAERRILSATIAENEFTIKRDHIKEFVNIVGQKGYPFCPSTFTKKQCREDTFEQVQLFVLTFDYRSQFNRKHNPNFSFRYIERKAKQLNLPILFSYMIPSTFDLSPDERVFCVVFLNEYPIYDYREAKTIQKALLTIFPEADQEHSDVINPYFGGNSLLSFDKTLPTIDPYIVFMNMCYALRKQYGPTNYKRKLAEFAEKTGIILDDRKLPVISFSNELAVEPGKNISPCFDENLDSHQNDKNSPKPITDRNSFGEKLSRLTYNINFCKTTAHEDPVHPESPKKPRTHAAYRSDDIKSIHLHCRLYQEFVADKKRQLSFSELLGLATNFALVESGKKSFLRTLRSNLLDTMSEETGDIWSYYFYYMKEREPYPCSSFCPYCETCSHGRNILTTCKLKPHQIEKIEGYEDRLVSLKEAMEDFQKNFYSAVESSDNIWHVIKSQTALGKTETILQWIKAHPEKKVLIVVPTNKLKREIQKRAKKLGIEVVVSPSLHEIADDLPDNLWDSIEVRLDTGKSPIPPIMKVLKKKARKKEDRVVAKLLETYITERDMFYSSSASAVTTHRRLESIDLGKYDLVIIDEDYIFSTVLADRTTVPISYIKKLKNKLGKNDLLGNKVTKILEKIKREDYFSLEDIDFDMSYNDIDLKIDLHALCDATHFCYREATDDERACITFTKKPQFPDGIKFIMLSATANKSVCEYCFGAENVKFYECKEAELMGTLDQYYEESMSRSYLDEHLEKFDKIKNWSGYDHTITFKKYDQYCTDSMYYGNCVGCDVLKGENIDVIGTPHQPDWIYKLFAFTLGFDVYADLKPHTLVEHNGYRFTFTTFEDEILRTIQFYIIETDLEQAVGRARLLRCGATVNLFSDFPLKQAVLKKSKYEKHE